MNRTAFGYAAALLVALAPASFAQVGILTGGNQDIGDVGGAAGSASFDDGFGEYRLEGSGADIWGSADGMHFAWVEMSGPFLISAENAFVDPIASTSDWVKFGLMVRNNLTAGSSNALAMVRTDQQYRPQFRRTQDGGSGSIGDLIPFNTHLGSQELERVGNVINYYYTNGDTGERVLAGSVTLDDLEDPVYVGLAVTSHDNGVLSAGTIENLQITPYTFDVGRSFSARKYPLGGTFTGVTVQVNVVEGETADVVVTESAPEGWTVDNVVASEGDTSVSGNTITWTLTGASGSPTLTYDAVAAAEDTQGSWSGNAVSGDLDLLVTGDILAYAGPPETYARIFTEDFEGLELQPFVGGAYGENPDAGDGTDWTQTPPEGWSIDNEKNGGVPGYPDYVASDTEEIGMTEWRGWSFADKNSWISSSGGQNRSEYTLGEGTVAVVDPDEWDDTSPDPESFGTYNTFLSTPSIDISNRISDSIIVTFDSSWWDEDTQDANFTVAYDGGTEEEVFYWASSGSPTADVNYKGPARNEVVYLELTPPAGAQNAVFTFGMLNATNDWWWAIDNMIVAIETGEVSVDDWSMF